MLLRKKRSRKTVNLWYPSEVWSENIQAESVRSSPSWFIAILIGVGQFLLFMSFDIPDPVRGPLGVLLFTPVALLAFVNVLNLIWGNAEGEGSWREQLVMACIAPLVMLVLVLVALLAIPAACLLSLSIWYSEQRLQNRLTKRGRFMPWPAVEANLISGEGTLIIECCGPKGPFRYWWSEDDITGQATCALPTNRHDCYSDQAIAYSQMCMKKYEFDDLGLKFAEVYPRAKVVTLFRWPTDKLTVGDFQSTVAYQGNELPAG